MELNDVMIEGEQGEDSFECTGYREDQVALMFQEDMRELRKNCVSDSLQKSYPLRPNWCTLLELLENNFEQGEFTKSKME